MEIRMGNAHRCNNIILLEFDETPPPPPIAKTVIDKSPKCLIIIGTNINKKFITQEGWMETSVCQPENATVFKYKQEYLTMIKKKKKSLRSFFYYHFTIVRKFKLKNR